MQQNKVIALNGEEKLMSWEDSIAAEEAQVSTLQYENKAFLAANTLLGLFYSEDWIFICCDLLARNFIMPYVRVMKKTYSNNKLILQPAENHPLQPLLDDPTIYGDGAGFWYRAAIFYNLLGNTFLWYMRANNKLLLLPSNEVMLKFGPKNNLLESYLWNGGTDAIGNYYSFNRNDVLHIQRPNPGSIWWGLSPFVPGHRSILFNRYSQEFLNSFFEKGATPQTIVETEIINSPEAITTLAKSFEIVNAGRKNFRRPLVLPKGAKATQIDMTIADQKLVELVGMNRESIINLLAIPKHAVSLQEAGSLGSEESKTALRFMWQSTVKPMLKRFSEALTKFFQADLGQGYLIDYDVSDVEIASDEAKKKTEYANGLLQTHTVNEVRKLVFELPPLPGGDTIPSLLPQQTFGPGAFTQQSVSSPTMSPDPKPFSEQTSILKSKQIENILSHEGFGLHMKAVDEELKKTQNQMEQLATDMILAQLNKALQILKEEWVTRKTKAFDEEAFARRLKEEFSYPEWRKEYLTVLSDTTGQGYRSQLDLIFNRQNRDAVAALEEETATQRKNILARRALDSFSQISTTTSDNIIRAIKLGVENQNTLPEIMRALTQKFSELTFNRAKTIARTEALTAVSIGQKAAIRNAQDVIPDAKKVWITANDERVRGKPGGLYPDAEFSHWDLHGDIVDINDPFNMNGVKMQVPRDPSSSSPPGGVINCRCTVAIVDKNDADLINLPGT